MRRLDLVGEKYGRLEVKEYVGCSKHGDTEYRCKCDCGNERVVRAYNLRSGNTSSCGCLHKEMLSSARKTHGLSSSKLYSVWTAIIARCNHVNHPSYKYYGERGIRVCKEWEESFLVFHEWALSSEYQDNLTIDRKDNSGDYSPDNCKWSTKTEQQNNRRVNRFITFNGETKTLAQWSKVVGLKYNALQYRWSSGWSEEETLLTPKHGLRKERK